MKVNLLRTGVKKESPSNISSRVKEGLDRQIYPCSSLSEVTSSQISSDECWTGLCVRGVMERRNK
jgi:hypothetical protein